MNRTTRSVLTRLSPGENNTPPPGVLPPARPLSQQK